MLIVLWHQTMSDDSVSPAQRSLWLQVISLPVILHGPRLPQERHKPISNG
jgi:hypothetical protein